MTFNLKIQRNIYIKKMGSSQLHSQEGIIEGGLRANCGSNSLGSKYLEPLKQRCGSGSESVF